MMIRLFKINCAVFFLMVQFILGTANRVPPNTLTVTIINSDETITLNWKRTGQYLANHNLPVWFARRDKEPELIPDAMKDFGQFVMYHDVERSSAVVYSDKSKCLFGVIDTRFYIDGLPLNEVTPEKHYNVDGIYVKSRQSQSDLFHDDPPSFSHDHDGDKLYVNALLDALSVLDSPNVDSKFLQVEFPDDDEHRNDNNKLHQEEVDIFYAEILIFISNDIVQSHNADRRNLMSIVLYYLVHFNAIDMLYAKLKQDGVVIHLNIAGLVLESEKMVFPYVFPTEQSEPFRTIDAVETLYQMAEYIKKYQNIFHEDLFDFFYLSSFYSLINGAQKLHGIARCNVDVYEYRKYRDHHPYGMVVSYKLNYGDYVISAHEAAHVFNVDHDPLTEGSFYNNVQCHAIQQEVVCYCIMCLRWSEKSRKQFQAYVRTSLNRCYLLNLPRSLHQYGKPMTTITPSKQCDCYGYQSHLAPRNYLDAVGLNDCTKNLACVNYNKPIDHFIPKPIDGTPCDMNKVCWQNECRKLSRATLRRGRKLSEHEEPLCKTKKFQTET